MSQIRVAQATWEGKDNRNKAGRKCWENNTFLNEPVLIEGFYVFDDHRITDEHQLIMDDCLAYVPKAAEKDADVLAAVQAKLDQRKMSRQPTVRPDEVIIDDPLVRNPT